MAIERSWERQGPVVFTADGGSDGLVTISSVICFKVKQRVVISSATKPDLQLQVKRVISATQLTVGPLKDNTHPSKPRNNLLSKTDISAYTIADIASIRAEEQSKVRLDPRDIVQATYEQEPTIAWRTLLVDKIGKPHSSSNPLPITGSLTVSIDGANKQGVQNIITPIIANTEFIISLPDIIKRYQVRVRDHSSKGRIAFALGETSTKYWTLVRGTIFDSAALDLPASSSIYMSVSKPSQVVEVISYYFV